MGIRVVLMVALLLMQIDCLGQGFRFEPENKKRVSIPFRHMNNLVIIPVEVNGVNLNFLLDSGVDETILFSLDEREVSFDNLEKVMFKGLGSAQPIEGLKSGGNTVGFPGFSDDNHDIYIVLDQDLNFSGSIGIPVNGIIGYGFFKDYPVEIDYARKKIVVHRQPKSSRWKNYTSYPITIEASKPYMTAGVTVGNVKVDAKLLIDVGNSDAVWIFADRSEEIQIPARSVKDYLGRGFSGEVHGMRARIDNFSIGNHRFNYPIAAFPDSLSTQSIQMVRDRIGSIGGEILRRFKVVLDYRGKKIYLKKSAGYDDPFQYNMSGLDVQHEGMTWVRETVESGAHPTNLYDVNGEKIPSTFTFKFELKPVYSVSNVRVDSPAWESGIRQGDVITAINGRLGYRFSLQQISFMLKSEEGKKIRINIERNGLPMEFSFKLKRVL